MCDCVLHELYLDIIYTNTLHAAKHLQYVCRDTLSSCYSRPLILLVKEKAEILQQVNTLTQIKDELTEQVTNLTCDLEKERSKVHSLQNEITKLKVGTSNHMHIGVGMC